MEQDQPKPKNNIDPRSALAESAGLSDTPAKTCTVCKQWKPLTDFLRRTGKRSGPSSRRGVCKACRKKRKQMAKAQAPDQDALLAKPPKILKKRPLPSPPPRPEGADASTLRATREGIVRMRGRTDKGRRWQQETDLETAVILVREHAAVVVNRHTVRRIYTNKSFRNYILTRDNYTCHFCGEYGDTIDHLLPRAKGGHTTPLNCVCACNECNQVKADRSLDDFISLDGHSSDAEHNGGAAE